MTVKPKVLVVDDVPGNIQIVMQALKDDYSVVAATNGERALALASADPAPSMILLDVMMPEMDGYEVCRRLKEDEKTSGIPVMFITTLDEDANEEKGLDLGAVDYIAKPINPALVKKRVRNHLELKLYRDRLEGLVRERTAQIHKTRLEIIRMLGRAAEYKDNETGAHIIRMSKYSQEISLAYGVGEEEAELLLNAAPMHDVGKIGIPDSILQKPGSLDPDEWNIMKSHAYMGYLIIGKHDSEILQSASVIAYQHHEKWNGKGYPRGLKGEEIDLFSRIVALADVFDALTSERVYKKAWSMEDALDFVKRERGEHFDPAVVDAFFNTLPQIIKIKEEYADEQ
ncbi:MAG: HD domain-containing phosphohydrolase [Spirochaetota bacterium]